MNNQIQTLDQGKDLAKSDCPHDIHGRHISLRFIRLPIFAAPSTISPRLWLTGHSNAFRDVLVDGDLAPSRCLTALLAAMRSSSPLAPAQTPSHHKADKEETDKPVSTPHVFEWEALSIGVESCHILRDAVSFRAPFDEAPPTTFSQGLSPLENDSQLTFIRPTRRVNPSIIDGIDVPMDFPDRATLIGRVVQLDEVTRKTKTPRVTPKGGENIIIEETMSHDVETGEHDMKEDDVELNNNEKEIPDLIQPSLVLIDRSEDFIAPCTLPHTFGGLLNYFLPWDPLDGEVVIPQDIAPPSINRPNPPIYKDDPSMADGSIPSGIALPPLTRVYLPPRIFSEDLLKTHHAKMSTLIKQKLANVKETYLARGRLEDLKQMKDYMPQFTLKQQVHSALSDLIQWATIVTHLSFKNPMYTNRLVFEDHLRRMRPPASLKSYFKEISTGTISVTEAHLTYLRQECSTLMIDRESAKKDDDNIIVDTTIGQAGPLSSPYPSHYNSLQSLLSTKITNLHTSTIPSTLKNPFPFEKMELPHLNTPDILNLQCIEKVIETLVNDFLGSRLSPSPNNNTIHGPDSNPYDPAKLETLIRSTFGHPAADGLALCCFISHSLGGLPLYAIDRMTETLVVLYGPIAQTWIASLIRSKLLQPLSSTPFLWYLRRDNMKLIFEPPDNPEAPPSAAEKTLSEPIDDGMGAEFVFSGFKPFIARVFELVEASSRGSGGLGSLTLLRPHLSLFKGPKLTFLPTSTSNEALIRSTTASPQKNNPNRAYPPPMPPRTTTFVEDARGFFHQALKGAWEDSNIHPMSNNDQDNTKEEITRIWILVVPGGLSISEFYALDRIADKSGLDLLVLSSHLVTGRTLVEEVLRHDGQIPRVLPIKT